MWHVFSFVRVLGEGAPFKGVCIVKVWWSCLDHILEPAIRWGCFACSQLLYQRV